MPTDTLNLRNVLDTWVGRGRTISVEQLSNESGAEPRQIYRWEKGKATPTADELQSIFESRILPLTFRKQFADALFRRCHDLRVTLSDDAAGAGAGARNPLRITTDADRTLCDLEDAFHECLCDRSDGGGLITPAEAATIDPKVAKVEALIFELKKSVNGKRTKGQQTA